MHQSVTICVSFSQYDGGYVATSKDCRGLFVSHRSATKVFESVPSAIKLLFKAEHGIDVQVKEDPTFRPHTTSETGGLEIAFIAEAA